MRLPSKHSRLAFQALEPRNLLTAMFPAYVDGVFTFGGGTDGTPYGMQNTFLLETNPSASKVVYLDFDGHHSVNNSWGHNILFPPFNRQGSPNTFTNSELLEIQETFQNVAEDFAPFDINITTRDPGVAALSRSGGGDSTYGVRALATQATAGFGNGIGGVAFIGSFDSSLDDPVFVFNKGANIGAMTASHEVGHALGLLHDGLNQQEYHPGDGFGETSWGPIMGAPFGANVTQWSRGEYPGATQTQDDLSVITSYGFGFIEDDHDGALATATVVADPTNVFEWGIISEPTDVDTFQVTLSDGLFELQVGSFGGRPNLDVQVSVLNSRGNVLTTVNPTDSTSASLSVNLGAGTYWVTVTGAGVPGRYTDYGSLGFYTLTSGAGRLTGDFNNDGLLDGQDIDALSRDIHFFRLGSGDPATFDVTGDGAVDLADLDAWLMLAGNRNLGVGQSYPLGDANLDGAVDGLDFIAWNTYKFSRDPIYSWTKGNFNGDSVVDGEDFLIWNEHKFTSADQTPIARLADPVPWPLDQDAYEMPSPVLDPDTASTDSVSLIRRVTVSEPASSTITPRETAVPRSSAWSSEPKVAGRRRSGRLPEQIVDSANGRVAAPVLDLFGK